MTLKERYKQRNMEEKLAEFKKIVDFISIKLDVYHPILIELDSRNNLVVGDFEFDIEYFFEIRASQKVFDFNSEEGIRDFKNDFILYIYMKIKDVYIRTDLISENQICILY